MFSQPLFHRFILENKIIGFFEKPITLKSGRLSNWYVNWRTVAEDTFLLDRLTDFVLEFTRKKNLAPHCFYGVPEGATKMGVLCQYKWAKDQPNYEPDRYPLPMGRGKPKDHGDPKDKFFVGTPSGDTIILEDVTTTGGSLLSTIDALQAISVPVIAAIGLTNRNEKRDDGKSVAEAVREKGVEYFAMSNAVELLREMKAEGKATEEQWEMAKKYFGEFGVEAL